MAPLCYQQLDEARELTEQQLSQVLLDRNTELSQLTHQRKYSTVLNAHNIWAPQLYDAILRYATAANLTVVSRVLKLPREIRDTIYTHLWDSGGQQDFQRDLLYWWEHFDQPWVIRGIHPCESFGKTGATDLKPPYFVDQAFFGADFAREVLVRLQDTVGKDLRPCERNPIAEFSLIDASIEAFVKKDAFGVGKTMEELVRNLDLRINFQCDNHMSSELARQNHIAELEEGITALLSIPYSDRITIHDGQMKQLSSRPRIITLVIRQECAIDISVSLVPILRLVARARKGLSRTGFTMKILYHNDEIGLKILFEEDVWAWSDKDWKTNLKEKNSCKVDAEEWDLEKQAIVWEHVRNVVFNVKDDGA
ncbi:uncharacterized protein K460DRAFT_380857 [Cucurbitaria berberidis CBS 394.84]|uniref:Uncharacterized protein n=1 Tax=Cucurbitaria berberidis CBS 394.84 TaxID=1168544 RepID=A0A9P4G931_9PLEO|nr:uncharacterized protein K460DRAFT_380857 [Cucurbitaria berberidis CBS 394.84]KAF1841137.1 hypothetical protein K460DRAFT_380857 [Cucurbitaria berberidis CBS 394.84]